MKKLLTSAAAATLAILLAGCGSNEDAAQNAVNEASANEAGMNATTADSNDMSNMSDQDMNNMDNMDNMSGHDMNEMKNMSGHDMNKM